MTPYELRSNIVSQLILLVNPKSEKDWAKLFIKARELNDFISTGTIPNYVTNYQNQNTEHQVQSNKSYKLQTD